MEDRFSGVGGQRRCEARLSLRPTGLTLTEGKWWHTAGSCLLHGESHWAFVGRQITEFTSKVFGLFTYPVRFVYIYQSPPESPLVRPLNA
jgi:hypothetical protein